MRRSADLSNDWKLGVRKARKFDSSFREHGQTRDSFPDQRTERLSRTRSAGRLAVIQRAPHEGRVGTSNNIVTEQNKRESLQFLIVFAQNGEMQGNKK